jgi:hypothetical protein
MVKRMTREWLDPEDKNCTSYVHGSFRTYVDAAGTEYDDAFTVCFELFDGADVASVDKTIWDADDAETVLAGIAEIRKALRMLERETLRRYPELGADHTHTTFTF